MRSLIAPLTGLCLTLSVLPAQLSGTYTINPSSTLPRNYKSFKAAIYDLWRVGVSAPVVFDVSSATYTEDVSLVPISGMTVTKTVTFKSTVKHGAILAPNASKYNVGLYFSTSKSPIVGVIFDGLKFTAADYAIHATSPVTDLEVRNCLFESTLKKCGISGPSASVPTNWNLHHNRFNGGGSTTYTPIALDNANGCTIAYNDVELKGNYGIELSTGAASSTKPTKVFNNLIYGKLTSSSDRAGTYLKSTAYDVEVTHNSLLVDSVSGSALRVSGFFTRAHKVYSNVLTTVGTGPIVTVDSLSTYNYTMNGNCFYAKSGPIVSLFGKFTSYPSLSAWQTASTQDANSIQKDPLFEGDLTSPFNLSPKQTSPVIGAAKSTPSYVTDDFVGNSRTASPDIGAYQVQVNFVTFGTGCAGAGGVVPVLGHTGNPVIGSNDFAVTLSKANGSSSGAWFCIGASTTSWNGTPIPLKFGGGCDVLISPNIRLLQGISGLPGSGNGSSIIKLAIPNDQKYSGFKIYFQWLVIDSSAKGAGLATSNAAKLTL